MLPQIRIAPAIPMSWEPRRQYMVPRLGLTQTSPRTYLVRVSSGLAALAAPLPTLLGDYRCLCLHNHLLDTVAVVGVSAHRQFLQFGKPKVWYFREQLQHKLVHRHHDLHRPLLGQHTLVRLLRTATHLRRPKCLVTTRCFLVLKVRPCQDAPVFILHGRRGILPLPRNLAPRVPSLSFIRHRMTEFASFVLCPQCRSFGTGVRRVKAQQLQANFRCFCRSSCERTALHNAYQLPCLSCCRNRRCKRIHHLAARWQRLPTERVHRLQGPRYFPLTHRTPVRQLRLFRRQPTYLGRRLLVYVIAPLCLALICEMGVHGVHMCSASIVKVFGRLRRRPIAS